MVDIQSATCLDRCMFHIMETTAKGVIPQIYKVRTEKKSVYKLPFGRPTKNPITRYEGLTPLSGVLA